MWYSGSLYLFSGFYLTVVRTFLSFIQAPCLVAINPFDMILKFDPFGRAEAR